MMRLNAKSMNQLQMIRQLEEISANAWNAPYSSIFDGWLVRYASGYTRRANSVIPLYRSNIALEDKLAYCEQFYNQRSLPTIFKITEVSEPIGLDEQLGDFDYTASAYTSVQILDLKRQSFSVKLDVESLDVRSYPSKVWLESFYEMSRVRPMYHTLTRAMLSDHLLQPAHFVLLWEKREPVALALMVDEQGYTGIFDVVVHPDWRGQGLGRRLMLYLLTHAQQSGSSKAYLQVMLNNERALRLYESLGFEETYRYWYREKPLPV